MTKEEFQKLMADEQAKGMKAVGLTISSDELVKISVAMEMADKIISQVGSNAGKEKNMELVALCLLATEGIDMVQKKLILPVAKMAEQKQEKKAEE